MIPRKINCVLDYKKLKQHFLEDVQQKVTKQFRKNVLKWVELDDNVRALKAKIKEINEREEHYNLLAVKRQS